MNLQRTLASECTRAFTVVELLVVVAIIAMLEAILFPVFSRAKNVAKGTACLSNLRQIGQGTLLYMGDSDDLFPYMVDAGDRAEPGQWASYPAFMADIPQIPLVQDLLQSYTKSREIFRCPSDTGTAVIDDLDPLVAFLGSPSDYATFGSSYFYRTKLTILQETQTSLAKPADANLLYDAAGHWHGAGGEMLLEDSLEVAADKRRQYRYNTLFADMHAKSLTSDQRESGFAQD